MVILGQHHPPEQDACAFSVARDLVPPLPKALKNIHAELQSDLGLVHKPMRPT